MKHLLLLLTITTGIAMSNTYVKEINQLLKSDEFKQDAKRALLIDKYYDLEIRKDKDNISNYKKPYEQQATIEVIKQWNLWIKDYCDKIVNGKYTQLRVKADNGKQEEADARMLMEEKLNNNRVLSQCQFALKRNQKIENDAKFSYFVDDIPSSLKYYSDDLDSAMASGVGLKSRFSDVSGSIYKTLRNVKSRLSTMITLHEILADNDNSKNWRNEFEHLNERYKQIRKDKLDDIAKKFKKPFDVYKGKDGEAVREKISTLYRPDGKNAEIILNDNSMRSYKVILNETQGVQYHAIAFYALVENDKNRNLHYGWYQKNSETNEETVTIVTSENFGEIVSKSDNSNDKNDRKKKREDDNNKRKADIDAQVAQQIAQANAQRDRILEQAKEQSNDISGNNTSNYSLMSLVTSLIMILAGVLLTRKTILGFLSETTANKLAKLLDKISPYLSVMGFVLIALGLYGLLMSIIHINILSILISIVAVITGFLLSLNKIINFDASTFKGNQQAAEKIEQTITKYKSKISLVKSQSLPIGITAIITGIYQLLF